MNISTLFDFSEIALAGYGQFTDKGPPPTEELIVLNHDPAGFASSQATYFQKRFGLLKSTFNDATSEGGSGFTSLDVSIFQGRVDSGEGQIVLAFRGTQQKFVPGAPTDVEAVEQIRIMGLAANQIVAMYNWWQRVSTRGRADLPQFEIVRLYEGETKPLGALRLSDLQMSDGTSLPAADYLIRGPAASSVIDPLNIFADVPDRKIAVTGSSLGGHLAMAFVGLFSDRVSLAVAFNSPGFPDNDYVNTLFRGLGGAAPKPGDPAIVNVVSSETQGVEDVFNLIAGFPGGNFPGQTLTIPIENQFMGDVPDPKRPSYNHDQRQVTDALTVLDMLRRLDPGLTLTQFGLLLRASANGQNRSLENLVDGVEVLLGIDRFEMEAGNVNRNALHLAVQRLVGGSPAYPVAHPQFAALAGHVSVKLVTKDLMVLAASEFGMVVALQDLSSIYLTAVDSNPGSDVALTEFWQQSRAVAFEAWTAEKDAVTPVVFSDSWLQDRVTMLEAIAYRNERDLAFDTPQLGARNTDMYDMGNHESIVLRRGGLFLGSDVRKVTFGDDRDNMITGDAWDDRLYGGSGTDRLDGRAGDDYLEGGRGSDTYVFTAEFGRDTIHDLDGLGVIELDGRTLRGGRSSGFADEWRGDGVDGATEHYMVRDSLQSATGKQLVITREGESTNRIVVNNFDLTAATKSADGFLGMRLDDSQQCLVVAGAGDDIRAGALQSGFWDTVVGTLAGATMIGEGSAASFTVLLRSAARAGEVVSLAVSDLADQFKLVRGSTMTSAHGATIALQQGQTVVSFGLLQHGELAGNTDVTLQVRVTHDGASVVSNAWTLQLHDIGDVTQTVLGDQIYRTRVSSSDVVRDDRIVVAAGGLAYTVGSDNNLVAGDDVLLQENVLYGSSGNDRIDGLSGNDALDGGEGNDRLDGGDGDDLMAGGPGDNHLVGGAGNDFLAGSAVLSRQLQQQGPNDLWLAPAGKAVLGQGATWGVYLDAPDLLIWNGVVGEGVAFGANVIDAGDGHDAVIAGSGDDRVDGGAGNDRIDGMGGADFIDAGSGNDVVWGDGIVIPGYLNSASVALHGADHIDGGIGDDEIHGGGGSDQLFGGFGADVIYGDSSGRSDGALFVDLTVHGSDTLDGEAGDDYLEGGGGDDTLLGGEGADRLWGDTTASNIVGNASGATTLSLGMLAFGHDMLDGEGGDDHMVGGGGDDDLFGGDGHDALWGDESNPALAGGFHGADTLDGGIGDDVLVGGGDDDILLGGDGADQLSGDDVRAMLAGNFHGDDYLDGGAGDDVLIGGGGADILFGGAGDDTLTGDTLATDLAGMAFDGDDQLHGGDGHDHLSGGGGQDALYGGTGNDHLDGGADADHMRGGGGDDIYFVDDAGDIVLEFADEGFDTVFSSVNMALPDHVENLIVTGDAPVAAVGNARDNTITGNVAANHFLAGAGNDRLNGGGGADLLEGGAGDDTYDVSDPAQQVIENPNGGYDRVSTSVSHVLHDNVEHLMAIGSAHLQLTGNAGDNALFGNPGDNLLDGGAGDDYLSGGAGNDVYLFSRGAGHDTLGNTDVLRDSADLSLDAAVDTLRFGPGIAATDVVGWRTNDDMVLAIRGTDDQVAIAGYFEADQVDGTRVSDHKIDRVAFTDGPVWDPVFLQTVVNKATHNRAPALVTPLTALHGRALDGFVYVVPGNTFIDPDADDVVGYSAERADGSPLPDWLDFDPLTRRLTGRPLVADAGVLNLAIWATDSYGKASGTAVSLTVHPLNRAPVLATPIPDQVAPYLGQFDYQVAPHTFSDPDWGDSMVLEATLADGSPLPDWLSYQALDRRFTGFSDTPQTLDVALTATDTGYLRASDIFTIVVGGPIIAGTEGDDTLTTPASGGTLHGQAGDDNLTGGAGNDVLVGGDGDDTLDGQQGRNFLEGGAGADLLVVGNDVVGWSRNTLLGGAGDDTLLARLFSIGNVLEGGTGNDAITGSGHGDTYRFNRGDGNDTITERETDWGLAGNDVLLFGPDIAAGDVQVARSLLPGSTNDLLLSIGAGSDTGAGPDEVTVKDWFASTARFSATERRIEIIRFADGTEWNSATLTSAALQVQGTELADTMTGSDGDDILRGLGGNDLLYAGRGNNILDGGDGDDNLYANHGQFVVHYFYSSGPSVRTYWASNLLLGGAGDDALHADGLAHGTVFDGGPGNDTLWGSRYNDTYRFNVGDGHDTLIENIPVEGFDDTLAFGPGIHPSELAVHRSGDDLLFSPGNTDDTLVVQNWFSELDLKIETVTFTASTVWAPADIVASLSTDRVGTDYGDTMSGTQGPDKMLGLSGNDALRGFQGDDRIFGGRGDDTLVGDGGRDHLYGGRGYDTLYGGSGEDTLTGDAADVSAAAQPVDTLVVFARGRIGLNVWPKMEVWIGGVWVQTFNVDSADFAAYVVDVPSGMFASEIAVAFTNDAYRPELGQDRNLYVDRIEVNGMPIGARGAGAVTDFGSGAAAFDGRNTMSSWGGLNSHGAIRFSLLGSDLLDGGAGADTMAGGLGNDIYIVDDSNDSVIELAGGGHDIVRASVSHGLSDHVEDLELTGSAAIDATGNDGRNTLRGNAAANRLDGGLGGDMMAGGLGDDIYVVDDMADLAYERVGGGTDTVLSSVSHTLRTEVENLTLTGNGSSQGNGNHQGNLLIGNDAANTLRGGAGNDTLRGEQGNDMLYGGAGDDMLTGDAVDGSDTAQPVDTLVVFARGTACLGGWPTMEVWIGGARVQNFQVDSGGFAAYVVDVPPGMVATEVAVAFTNDAYRPDLGQDRNLYVDRIEVNGRVLGARKAGVVLDFGSGEGAFDGFNTASSWGGMSSNSALHFGLLGADRLDGGAGADLMHGGKGNDSYIVDNSLDAVMEAEQGGHDIVRSSATFTLAANIEDLELTGSDAIDGTGNATQNTLRGNKAANRLDGAGGTDLLVGGAGGDAYVLAPGNGRDSIYEYDLTPGVTDTAEFTGDVAADQLWFSRTGSSLQVDVIGTGDQLRVSGWFAGTQHHVEAFITSGGKTLLDSQVQNLVDAMAAFAPPPMGQTSLSGVYAEALNATIAANWH